MTKRIDIYDGRDPREIATYRVGTASSYLGVPSSTLRSWASGGSRLFAPAKRDPLLLSFFNLVESHVLKCIRRDHRIKMSRVRRALDTVSREMGVDRPLIGAEFQTDGATLFVERLGELVDVGSAGGPQYALKEMLEASLARIERDDAGLAALVYPWVNAPTEPRVIAVDPRRSFGRPVVAGTRIPAEALVERFNGGDGIAALARDYGLTPSQVEYVVRWGRGIGRVGAA